MSVENTNTPNGTSKKNWYDINIDEIELNYVDCSTIDDLTKWEVPGDGLKVDDHKSIDVTNAIKENGSLTIKAVLVGKPMINGLESKGQIGALIEEAKYELTKKGALTAAAYIKLKQEKAEKTNASREEKDENDKDHNGIDDRNEN